MRASAGNEDGTEEDAMSRRLLLTVAHLLGSTTGRRRSIHLTGGGLIGVRRPVVRRLTAMPPSPSLLRRTHLGPKRQRIENYDCRETRPRAPNTVRLSRGAERVRR